MAAMQGGLRLLAASTMVVETTVAMASQHEIEVDVVLPGRKPKRSLIDASASFAALKEGIVAVEKLGDASSYVLAVCPGDPSIVVGRFTPSAGDVLVILEATSAGQAIYKPLAEG
jgi:hypothetical protein